MAINRRTFIGMGLGGTGIWGAFLLHQLRNHAPMPEAIADPTPPSRLAIAPRGMFAPVRGTVRIVAISDLNSQYGSTDYDPEVDRAIALIPDWQPDLVLCGGDMVAGQKRSLSKAQLEAMWASFDRHIASPLRKARLPFAFTIGNHDGSGAISGGKFSFQGDRDVAAAYWNSRESGLNFIDRAGYPFYYSFQQNGIFYLVWDASTDRIPTEQLAWAERSLGSATARSAKLRLAIGHLPLYAVARGRETAGNYLAQGDSLRSLLEKYRVHTYISGHHHAYFPGKKGNLELLHAGALGSGPRPLLAGSMPPRKTLTVVDVDLDPASTRYTTYDMKTQQVIDLQSLPAKISSPTGIVWRRDVAPSDRSSE